MQKWMYLKRHFLSVLTPDHRPFRLDECTFFLPSLSLSFFKGRGQGQGAPPPEPAAANIVSLSDLFSKVEKKH